MGSPNVAFNEDMMEIIDKCKGIEEGAHKELYEPVKSYFQLWQQEMPVFR